MPAPRPGHEYRRAEEQGDEGGAFLPEHGRLHGDDDEDRGGGDGADQVGEPAQRGNRAAGTAQGAERQRDGGAGHPHQQQAPADFGRGESSGGLPAEDHHRNDERDDLEGARVRGRRRRAQRGARHSASLGLRFG